VPVVCALAAAAFCTLLAAGLAGGALSAGAGVSSGFAGLVWTGTVCADCSAVPAFTSFAGYVFAAGATGASFCVEVVGALLSYLCHIVG
jgi:hypothetical protein